MKLFAVLVFAGVSLCQAAEGRAASYARAVQQAGLDPDHCYRVRDLTIFRDELKFYLTEGHLIFSREVEGRRFGAVFTADLPGGDGEVLVMPPLRSERLSLASFAKTPNLSEHFTAAVFLFSDGTGEELMEQIQAGEPRKAPEAGLLLAERYSDTLRNLAGSYEIRLVQDHFSSSRGAAGVLYAAIAGKKYGNLDFVYDARQRDQITIGQVVYREDRRFFDIWTSFESRSFRTGRKQTPPPGFTIRQVSIDATLAPDLAMRAATRIRFDVTAESEGALAFDISNRMRVTEAKVDGEPAELFSRESLRADLVRRSEGNSMFLVIPPKPMRAGSTHTIEFTHEGNVVTAAGNGVYFVGARTSWYPNRDASFALYDLTFRHPKSLQLVATGEMQSERVEGDTRTVRHTTSSPIRFAGFNLGRYDKSTLTRAGVTVEVYANRTVEAALQRSEIVILTPPPPFPRSGNPRNRTMPELLTVPVAPSQPNPSVRLNQLASEVASAVEYMSSLYGPPPLKALTVSPIPGTFGQGFPGLLYLSTLAYLNPSERPASVQSEYQRTFYSELLHAHETAHQWWGNMVTSAHYQDDWLMEALANYSAMMILEKKKGRRALDSVLEEYREHLLSRNPDGRTLESVGPIIWGIRLHSSQSPGAWRTIVYEKGSWIMHMLRMRMGDAAFLKMLGELCRRKRYKPVSTSEFQSIAAEFLPPGSEDPKLEAFFDQWVYNTGIPTLRMKYEVQGKAPKVRLRGTITQTDADEEFSALVPVEVQLPLKKTITHWVRTSSEPVQFHIDLKAAPLRVLLDPGNAVLARK